MSVVIFSLNANGLEESFGDSCVSCWLCSEFRPGRWEEWSVVLAQAGQKFVEHRHSTDPLMGHPRTTPPILAKNSSTIRRITTEPVQSGPVQSRHAMVDENQLRDVPFES